MELTEEQIQIMRGKICPYCKAPSVLSSSEHLYGGTSYGFVYECKPCKAYVGCHSNTDKAKGRLANRALRLWKKEAHKYFDLIWKNEFLSRTEAYKWLSEKLELPAEYTHIGMFSEQTCKEVIYFSKQLLNDMRRLDLDFGREPQTPFYEL